MNSNQGNDQSTGQDRQSQQGQQGGSHNSGMSGQAQQGGQQSGAGQEPWDEKSSADQRGYGSAGQQDQQTEFDRNSGTSADAQGNIQTGSGGGGQQQQAGMNEGAPGYDTRDEERQRSGSESNAS